MAKNDIKTMKNVNGKTIAISNHRWRRHDGPSEPKPINRKTSHKPKRDQEQIKKFEASMAGGKKMKRLNSKNGNNWRKKEEIFYNKTKHVPEGHMKHAKKQKHFRNSDYYDSRRAIDPAWAKNKPDEPKQKSKWEQLFPWIKRR